jgi:hypothetical protein
MTQLWNEWGAWKGREVVRAHACSWAYCKLLLSGDAVRTRGAVSPACVVLCSEMMSLGTGQSGKLLFSYCRSHLPLPAEWVRFPLQGSVQGPESWNLPNFEKKSEEKLFCLGSSGFPLIYLILVQFIQLNQWYSNPTITPLGVLYDSNANLNWTELKCKDAKISKWLWKSRPPSKHD